MSKMYLTFVLVAAVSVGAACTKAPEAKQDTASPADVAHKIRPAAEHKNPPPQGQVVAKGVGYRVEIRGESANVGAENVSQVVLVPTDGYHVNMEFPTSLEISATNAALKKDKLDKPDAKTFAEEGATFEVAFTPKAAGKTDFTGVFRFAVCTDTTCDPSRESLAWNIDTK